MIRIWHSRCLFLLLAVLCTAPLWGDDVNVNPDQPTIIPLTLHPAAPSAPALKFELLRNPTHRRPGNAAQFYYRALLMYYQNPNRQALEKEYFEKSEAWTSVPCEGQTREEMKKWVAGFPRGAAEQLQEAVHREHCDFDFRLNEVEGPELISFLLPEIQEMRTLGRYLSIKARVEIAEGRFDDAAETFRMSYQIGKDTGSEPLLINGLVGVAIASITSNQVEHWIGSPKSPNLYWPLSALPQPLVDLRPALRQETRLPEKMFSFLDDAETSQRSPEEWQRVLREGVQLVSRNLEPLNKLQEQNLLEQFQAGLAVTALIMRAYPIAKTALQEDGFAADRLEKMPVAQVVAIHMQRTVREIADEFSKGAYLPTPQREEYYEHLETRMREEFFGPNSKEVIPLAQLLMPAVGQAISAQTRQERDFAALRTLEAIRAHLAEKGTLPQKLSEITVVPLPVNPVTGEPFGYHLVDGVATLDVPPVRKNQPPQFGKRYVLTVAK